MARTSGSKGTASNARGAREILLDTAERLLAEHGIDGVSMRQIAAAAGQGNNSVIQYHFGDKAGLLREIILRRVAGFEPRRQSLFAGAAERGRLISRLALHASELTITHPITRERFTLASGLPNEFEVALKYLRKFPAR